MECPLIDRSFIPVPEFNKPVEYPLEDGSVYIFYEHWDGFDRIYKCQFCQRAGRVRDVFKCLNESEWRTCSYRRGEAQE